jgi:hypothetical protein
VASKCGKARGKEEASFVEKQAAGNKQQQQAQQASMMMRKLHDAEPPSLLACKDHVSVFFLS